MTRDKKPCVNGCGRLDIKNQSVHNRHCPKLTPQKTQDVKKESWLKRQWKKHFGRKVKSEMIQVDDPAELIEGLKSYEIPEKNPKTGLGAIFNKEKDYIQVVLVSEIIEPKTFWAEKKGINRITYKDRMFILPRDIRGNVFFWHMDKKECLVDTAKANNEDAESSLHESQVANIYYTLGRVASQNEMWGNIKLILLVNIFIILLIVGGFLYLSMIQKDINNNANIILGAINNTVAVGE